MAISKVVLNGNTLMDATAATASASDILSPKTAVLADGEMTSGTGSAPSGTKQITIDENGTVTEDVAAYASAEITVNVQGGDTLEIKGVHSVELYWQSGLPVKYKIISDLLSVVWLRPQSNDVNVIGVTTPIEEIEIAANQQTTGVTFNADLRYNGVYALRKINLNFIPLAGIYAFGFLYGTNKNPYFEDLLGLNFMLVGGGNYKIGSFSNLGALKNITCKPNTLGQLDMVASNRNWWNLSQSSLLTDDSLCQIANALCATYTSTLTLHATPKARCQSLMGTVSSVTDDTGTYDFFTQDASGTVSLADFITQMKGWTLA